VRVSSAYLSINLSVSLAMYLTHSFSFSFFFSFTHAHTYTCTHLHICTHTSQLSAYNLYLVFATGVQTKVQPTDTPFLQVADLTPAPEFWLKPLDGHRARTNSGSSSSGSAMKKTRRPSTPGRRFRPLSQLGKKRSKVWRLHLFCCVVRPLALSTSLELSV
jgi:hypothetical protein